MLLPGATHYAPVSWDLAYAIVAVQRTEDPSHCAVRVVPNLIVIAFETGVLDLSATWWRGMRGLVSG